MSLLVIKGAVTKVLLLRRLSRLPLSLPLSQYSNGRVVVMAIALFAIAAYAAIGLSHLLGRGAADRPALLSDPFLQAPTADSVQVVWFTEFAGSQHQVSYGANLEQTAIATTTTLSRIREDQKSRVGAQTEDNPIYTAPTARAIWRHQATVTGLSPGQPVPYRVSSTRDDGRAIASATFSLAPLPPANAPLKVLLTSDHQLMPMTAANLQAVVNTVGRVDAVFMAGDLVNIPDRASEWFDDTRGRAFFPSLQGRAASTLEVNGTQTTYRGGAIIQNAPLFPALGNHEVMGQFSTERDLNEQYDDTFPRPLAAQRYSVVAAQVNPSNDPAVRDRWIHDHSFNTDTFDELFSLPDPTHHYYAITVGDIRLVVLEATNIWRSPSLEPKTRGRYRERDDDLDDPSQWGYGQHLFEAIAQGSPQYTWLQAELASPAFRQARYKVVMFHHPPHSLGDNVVPAYTNPVQSIDIAANGQIQSVHYEYPRDNDYLIRDIMPLLESAGVQLVFYGHSHLWNRFDSPAGMHFLESSNVGNTYGAFPDSTGQKKRRPIPVGFDQDYAATGDPNGLAPVMPTVAPLTDDGQPLPYIASNSITAFSILDTSTATVSSYYFDTATPTAPAVLFDQFTL